MANIRMGGADTTFKDMYMFLQTENHIYVDRQISGQIGDKEKSKILRPK